MQRALQRLARSRHAPVCLEDVRLRVEGAICEADKWGIEVSGLCNQAASNSSADVRHAGWLQLRFRAGPGEAMDIRSIPAILGARALGGLPGVQGGGSLPEVAGLPLRTLD